MKNPPAGRRGVRASARYAALALHKKEQSGLAFHTHSLPRSAVEVKRLANSSVDTVSQATERSTFNRTMMTQNLSVLFVDVAVVDVG